MDLQGVKITKADVDRILKEARPARPAGFTGDACKVYSKARPLILTAVAILSFVYPPAATAIASLVAIMDKACEKES